jgi:FkbM family methyltransferase
MELISYAQNFEDVRLWRAFRDVTNGRYLDVGTHDPNQDSVSRLFYDRGWRGVHVEPTPHYAAAMRSARPDEHVIEAAVSRSPAPLAFFEIPNTGLSTGVPEIAKFHEKAGWSFREILVPTVTLAGLFEFMGEGPIHWLKIDVEGMEPDVLASWGDHPARPAALVIEATKPSTQEPAYEHWHTLVTQRGYREVLFDGLSLYFLHESEAHRAEALALSPNVFDGFQVLRTHFSAAHMSAENDQVISAASSELAAQAEAHSEALAQAHAAAANASSQLEAALQRAGELEDQIAAHNEAHAQELYKAHNEAAAAAAELEAARQALVELEGRLAAEADEHARALAQANAAALAASAQLADAKQRAAECEGQLTSEAAAHREAMARARVEAAEAAGRLDAALQRVAALEERYAQEAEGYARHLAEAHAAAAKASAQLEAMAQRTSELEQQIASDATKLVQLQSDTAAAEASLDEARRKLTALQHELAVENAAHGATKAQASAVAAELGAKLDLADTRVQELQLRLEDQTRLHEAALDLARERIVGVQRALAEATAQLRAVMAEHQALGRETGRLEGQLEAQEQRYAADMAGAAAQQQDMRDRLGSAEQELAAVRDLAANLRAQLAVQIARSEAAAAVASSEKEAAKALLEAVREESRSLQGRASDLAESLVAVTRERDDYAARLEGLSINYASLAEELEATRGEAAEVREHASLLSGRAADLAARLTSVSQERDEIATELHMVSLDRASLADEIEATRKEAAKDCLALRQEIESLQMAIVQRERRIALAEGLLAGLPDPLAHMFGLRKALARRLIGVERLSAIASHAAAAQAWRQEGPQSTFPSNLDTTQNLLDCACEVSQGPAAEMGAALLTDECSVTSVAQLLALHDRRFINAAYCSLLGRAPDGEGEAYYLGRLRAGVHKLAILKQIRHSAEGRAFVSAVAGLDRAIDRYRWAMLPLLGIVLRFVWRIDGNGPIHRGLRAITNDLARLRSELAGRLAEYAALADAVRELEARPVAPPHIAIPQTSPDPESRIDEPDGHDMTAEHTVSGIEKLGRDASRVLRLMAKSMQTRVEPGGN